MERAIRGVILGAVAAVLAFSGCIVPAPGTDGESQQQAVVEAAPVTLQNGAILDDKVEILGVKLDPGRALPGEKVKVTTFFKVLDAIPQDYLIFVHAEDVDGKVERVNFDHPPANGAYPTSQWKKGETVQDPIEITVPQGIGRGLNLWIGLWHAPTDTRMQLKNPDRVRNDGKNRILLATLPVGLAR